MKDDNGSYLVAIAIGAVSGFVVALLLIGICLLSACGSAPVIEPIKPPNTEIACDRAIACGVFLQEQRAECLACVETVAEKWNEEARAYCGDECPALDDVPCEYITDQAHRTHLSLCVAGRWFGP